MNAMDFKIFTPLNNFNTSRLFANLSDNLTANLLNWSSGHDSCMINLKGTI